MTFKIFQHKHSSFYQQNLSPVPDNMLPDNHLFIVIHPLVWHLIIVAIGNCVLGIVLQFGITFVGSFVFSASCVSVTDYCILQYLMVLWWQLLHQCHQWCNGMVYWNVPKFHWHCLFGLVSNYFAFWSWITWFLKGEKFLLWHWWLLMANQSCLLYREHVLHAFIHNTLCWP
jgi:hypothetical protein